VKSLAVIVTVTYSNCANAY